MNEADQNSHHGFKRIHAENWNVPDIPRFFPDFSESLWVQTHLAVYLNPNVPADLQKLFEVSRGAMIYGWFFYPLLTVGAQQAERLLESAVWMRCKNGGWKVGNYHNNLKTLVQHGVIAAEDESRWQAARMLRNAASHQKQQTIYSPGMAFGNLALTAEWLNQLFP